MLYQTRLYTRLKGSCEAQSWVLFQSRICRLSPNHRLSESRLIPLVTSNLLENSSMGTLERESTVKLEMTSMSRES